MKSKTTTKAKINEYLNFVQGDEVDLLKLAQFLAIQSNGLFEIRIIKKTKNKF
jgi:hypothetical protein